MADSATTKRVTRAGALFARRYGLAFVSVAGALLLELLFHRFNFPHPFSAFALSATAITFWYGGRKPGKQFCFRRWSAASFSRPRPAASLAFFMSWSS
jgi:hypothetical protein